MVTRVLGVVPRVLGVFLRVLGVFPRVLSPGYLLSTTPTRVLHPPPLPSPPQMLPFIKSRWDMAGGIQDALLQFIRVPNQSPGFDPQAHTNGPAPTLLGVVHRVLLVVHRVLGVLHRVLGVVHRIRVVVHGVLAGPTSIACYAVPLSW